VADAGAVVDWGFPLSKATSRWSTGEQHRQRDPADHRRAAERPRGRGGLGEASESLANVSVAWLHGEEALVVGAGLRLLAGLFVRQGSVIANRSQEPGIAIGRLGQGLLEGVESRRPEAAEREIRIASIDSS
jgi:hypothetical protein